MNYGETKHLLTTIVEWLRGTDEVGWFDQTQLAYTCHADLVELDAPKPDPTKGAEGQTIPNPYSAELKGALPHVWTMMKAMERRDRITSLVEGEIALMSLS